MCILETANFVICFCIVGLTSVYIADGKSYYHNSDTGETVWDRPEELGPTNQWKYDAKGKAKTKADEAAAAKAADEAAAGGGADAPGIMPVPTVLRLLLVGCCCCFPCCC